MGTGASHRCFDDGTTEDRTGTAMRRPIRHTDRALSCGGTGHVQQRPDTSLSMVATTSARGTVVRTSWLATCPQQGLDMLDILQGPSQLTGAATVRCRLTPTVVRVDCTVATGHQLAHDAGLASPRHAGQQDALHSVTLSARARSHAKEAAWALR